MNSLKDLHLLFFTSLGIGLLLGGLNNISAGEPEKISESALQQIRALVSLEQIENLAGLAEVKFIRRAAKARANTGSVDSEGDVTHRADFARNTFGVTGQGVKVGVLSDSIDYLASSQNSGDLGDVK